MDKQQLKKLVRATIKENYGIYSGNYDQQKKRTNSYQVNDEGEGENSAVTRLKSLIQEFEESQGFDMSVRIGKSLVKNKPLMAEMLRLLVVGEETSELLEEFLNSFDND
tara:strand:+ start:89 stop:415 length:327 start_codon:yes stop_codon:yes gene_type:complete